MCCSVWDVNPGNTDSEEGGEFSILERREMTLEHDIPRCEGGVEKGSSGEISVLEFKHPLLSWIKPGISSLNKTVIKSSRY